MSDTPRQTSPRLGALAVVVTPSHVLLARRSNPPDAGLWGFPGGHVELGETGLAAAARELREETGVLARPVECLANIDLLRHDSDGTVRLHYMLTAVLCVDPDGTPRAADDVSDAAWVPLSDIWANALPMSDRVATVTRQALARYQVLRAAARP